MVSPGHNGVNSLFLSLLCIFLVAISFQLSTQRMTFFSHFFYRNVLVAHCWIFYSKSVKKLKFNCIFQLQVCLILFLWIYLDSVYEWQGWGQISFIKYKYKYKYKYKNLDFSNTNTNTNILLKFDSNTNTNTDTSIQIQIQIQIRSTKYIYRKLFGSNIGQFYKSQDPKISAHGLCFLLMFRWHLHFRKFHWH